MFTFTEVFLWNSGLMLICYGIIRFFDWKLTPWLNSRTDGYSATLEAINQIRHLEDARDSIEFAHDVLGDAERERAQQAIDRRIEQVMERINRA